MSITALPSSTSYITLRCSQLILSSFSYKVRFLARTGNKDRLSIQTKSRGQTAKVFMCNWIKKQIEYLVNGSLVCIWLMLTCVKRTVSPVC